MKYQRMINLLDNVPNQLSKFRTKYWVEINYDSCGMYSTHSQNKLKTTVLCDYSDAYILVNGTILVVNLVAAGAAAENYKKELLFKNCPPFTDWISEVNNMRKEHFQDIDLVMQVYNIIEYSDKYLKKSASLRQCFEDKPTLTGAGAIGFFSW